MDQELERILANVQTLVAENAPESDIEEYLGTEGYTLASLDEALAPPKNTGPAEQPPFPTLPPMIGGALDALVAFGTGAGLGLPALLSKDTKGYMEELSARNPRATALTAAAGGAATAALGTLAATRAVPAAMQRAQIIRHTAPRGAFRPPVPRPPSPVRDFMMQKLLPSGGIGGGSVLAWELAKKLTGNR